MNMFKKGLLILTLIGPYTHGASEEFSKSDRKQIQTAIGYSFKSSRWCQDAFTHSSRGNVQFDRLETQGDKLIRGVVANICGNPSTMSAEELHKEIESKNTNVYFAGRYKALGLDRFLRSASDEVMVYANAMEALVAAVAEDYYEKHPHLKRGSPSVFRVLTSVVEKLLFEDILIAASIPLKPSEPSGKVKVSLVLQKAGTKHIQKATASCESVAETTALKAVWGKLGSSVKAKRKTYSALKKIAESDGWIIERNRL